MTSEFIAKTEAYVTKVLDERLPPELCFHNKQHTEEIVRTAEELGIAEGVSEAELEIIIISAWFHDVGYIESYVGHEEESQVIAEEFLQSIHYPPEKISIVKNCILATKFHHHSGNALEAILIDADRSGMGKPTFLNHGNLLRKEWETYLNKEYTDKEWSDVQVRYLQNSKFITKSANAKFSQQKETNLGIQQKLSLELQAEEETSFTVQSMAYVNRARDIFRSVSLSMILGFFIGFSLSITVWGFVSYAFIIGGISGFIIGLFLHFGSDVFDYRIIRKFSFPVALLIGTIVLIVLFKLSEYISVAIYNLIFTDLPIYKILENDVIKDIFKWHSFLNMLWTSFTISIILNFVKLTSRIIGPKLMFSYILGKYHRPIKEERIFMFIDINSSTTLAETMKTEKYHNFLNKFFHDIAGPISRYEGEIYQYVGDEVVVTWKMKNGIKNSNCIRCYFRIVSTLEKLKTSYIAQFDTYPQFKVGLHGGTVITGEVGKVKSEIVFHGDVINTTERILSECINLKSKILISENLLRRLDIQPGIKVEYVTTKAFKGKQTETPLYTLYDQRKS